MSDQRRGDHSRIEQLAETLLPELSARLAASGLGEIEVREDGWKIRIRRPAAGPAATPARTTTGTRKGADRVERAGHDHAPDDVPAPAPAAEAHRIGARSPAVGIFQAGPELRSGARVRQGDRLASVDVLGVPQEVTAPEDGIVVSSLVESGEGVEYGQELVILERVTGLAR
jgi:biotin carboxyl carrier protein